MEYKVSIIVPVYKAEKYLEKCVNSILKQTLDSIEIILLDDGSPDRCGEICDKFAEKYNNVVVFHLENGGPSKARNIGIKNAKGKYIGFVDSDDYIAPEMYKVLYDLAESNKPDIVMCSYFLDEESKISQIDMEYKSEYNGISEIKNGLLSLYSKRYHKGLYSVWNKLYNKSLLQTKNIYFNEELIRAEDAWFVFEALKVAKSVHFLNQAYYFYRQVPNSTMHTIQEDRYSRSKNFRLKVINECKDLNIIVDKNELYYEFIYETFTNCRSLIKQSESDKVKSILEDVFFRNACQYKEYLPFHLKILCFLEVNKRKRLLNLLLQLWSLV